MKKEKLSNVLGALDQSIIEEAAGYKKRKNGYIFLKRSGIIAACLSVILVLGMLLGLGVGNDSSHGTHDQPIPESPATEAPTDGSSVATSKDVQMLTAAAFVIPPVSDSVLEENFVESTSLDQKLYNTTLVLDPENVEKALYGYTLYNQSNTDIEECEAFAVKGMPIDSVIAVRVNGAYIAFAIEGGYKLLGFEDSDVPHTELPK